MLVCAGASVCVGVYALRIVARDKILRFKNNNFYYNYLLSALLRLRGQTLLTGAIIHAVISSR